MGTIRPVITDFSAGEVSPRLAGRTDSPIYTRSAKELTNFIPGTLGGIYRRGGFQHVIEAPYVNGISGARVTGKLRLIPWSVNDTLDFLLVLSDGRIDILNVSTGTEPGYIYGTNLDGSKDIITTIGAYPCYAEEMTPAGEAKIYPIDEVKYAQSIRQVFLAHNRYPLMQIKFISFDQSTRELKLEYGSVAVTGNVAWTPELKADTVATTDPFTAEAFIGMFGYKMVSGVTNAATGFVNGREIASIVKNVTAATRRATIKLEDIVSIDLINQTITDGSSTLIHAGANKSSFIVRMSKDSGPLFSIPYGATFTQALDILQANFYIIGTSPMYFGQDGYDSNPGWLLEYQYATKGSISFAKTGSSESYTINFKDAQSPLTLTSTTTGLTGYVTCLGLVLNKNVTPGDKMADRLSQWMTPGKVYPCDKGMKISGLTPERATRFDGKKRYGPPDANGYTPVISDSDSYIEVEGTDTEGKFATRQIRRGDAGVTGQLGVILTPFWNPGDNPGFVAFHQGRLVVGGSHGEPNVLYMSEVNVFTSFKYFEEVLFESTTFTGYSDDNVAQYTTRQDIIQQVGAASAIRLQLATEENEQIEWATSVADLVIGTATSEWVIPAGVTALDARVILTSRAGSKGIQGRFVNGSVIFVSRSGRKVSAFTAGQENTQDITAHADHIAKPVVTGFDFRQDPRQELYAVLADGTMLCGQILSDIVSWSRIKTRTGDKIKSVACLASWDEDAVYCAVERTIGGVTASYIERLYPADEDSFLGRLYLDSSVSKQADGTGVITGLARYSAYPVAPTGLKIIVNTGTTGYSNTGTPVVDAAGSCSSYIPDDQGILVTPVAIPIPAGSLAHIGFVYTSRVESFRIDAADTEGLDKSAGFLYLRLYKSGDLHILRYTDVGVLDVDVRATTPTAATVDGTIYRIYPYSGTLKLDHLGPSRPDQTVIIEAQGAEPAGIQSIAPAYSVSSLE